MNTLRATLALVLLVTPACHTDEDLFGPVPIPGSHVTARIDGQGFAALVSPDRCIGIQITPRMFFISVHEGGTWPTAQISIHLGDIPPGAGRYTIRNNEPQSLARVALYVPGDPAKLQYSGVTGSGEIQIDEYDPVARTLAGRFYFNAVRAVGTTGPEWIRVTEGSFRGTLAAWGSQGCF